MAVNPSVHRLLLSNLYLGVFFPLLTPPLPKGGWCCDGSLRAHLLPCLCVCIFGILCSSVCDYTVCVCASVCDLTSCARMMRLWWCSVLQGCWSSDHWACQSLWLISLLPLPPSFQSDPPHPLLPVQAPWWLITQSIRQVAVTSSNTPPSLHRQLHLKRHTENWWSDKWWQQIRCVPQQSLK